MTRDLALEAWFLMRLGSMAIPPFAAHIEDQERISEDRPTAIRPSNLGGCERKIAIQETLIGDGAGPWIETIPAALATKFDFGTHIHRVIQGAIPDLAHEIKVAYRGIPGTFDTRVDGCVIDWKTIERKGAAAIKKAGKAREDHHGQVNLYAVADAPSGTSRAAVGYIIKDGETATTFDADHILIFSGPIDVALADAWANKADRIRAHVAAESLPVYEPVLECRWCPVKAECFRRMPVEAEQHSKIVGSTMAEPERLAAFMALAQGDELRVEWEPSNAFGPRMSDDDTKAAAVMVFGPDGRQVGYLPATGSGTADGIARHLRNGGRVKATVKELTGGVAGKENRGVNVLLLLSD